MESNSRKYLRKGLQGTRPTALQISRGSCTISKSSNIRPMLQPRKPVIIYIRSPEVIHTNPQDFMALVQRLTGSSPTRSRCEESIIKREAAIEELRPPTSIDHSQSILNCSFDEYVSDISAFLQDDDQMGMDSAIVSLSANLGEELMEEFPPNMACLRVEGRGMSLPNLYPELQSGEIASWSANNAISWMPSQDECCAVQDYALNMYECGHMIDSLINSDSCAVQADRSTISDPPNVFTSFHLDPDHFSIPIPASLEVFNNVHEYWF